MVTTCHVFQEIPSVFSVIRSISVCTQADKYSTEHIDSRVEVFLETFNKILKETSEEDLDSVKEALMKVKQCADIHLKEEVSRNWAEVTTGEYMFDRIENELKTIEHIKIDELRDWMASHTHNGSNLRKLSVHVVGISKSIKQVDNENLNTEKIHGKCTIIILCEQVWLKQNITFNIPFTISFQ